MTTLKELEPVQPVEPNALRFVGPGDLEVWVCGHCMRVAPTKNDALTCYTCIPRQCTVKGCETLVSKKSAYHVCLMHREENRRNRVRERFKKATKILAEDYDHSLPCFSQDGDYFSSVSDFLDGADLDNCRLHDRFIFAARTTALQIDANEIISEAIEALSMEEPDCVFDAVEGRAEFEAAVKAFNEAQPEIVHYEDSGVVIVLPWPDPDTYWGPGGEDDAHPDWPKKWDHKAVARGLEDCLGE